MIFLSQKKTEILRVVGLSPVGWWNSDPQKAHLENKGFKMIPEMFKEKWI
jgi:hypothetical protein